MPKESDHEKDIVEMMYRSLTETALPDDRALDAVRQKYGRIDQATLKSLIEKARKRIENDRQEIQKYLDTEIESLDSRHSQLEGLVGKDMAPELADSIESLGEEVENSLSKYEGHKDSALAGDLWEGYSSRIDDIRQKKQHLQEQAVQSAKDALEELVLKYRDIEAVPDNIKALKQAADSAQEKKGILSRLNADTQPADSILANINGVIKSLEAKILEEKHEEQDRANKKNELYTRFSVIRDACYNNPVKGVSEEVLEEVSGIYSMMNSIGDTRADEISVFRESIAEELKSKEARARQKRKGIYKKAAAFIAAGFLAYAGVKVVPSAASYFEAKAEKAKAEKVEAAAKAEQAKKERKYHQQNRLARTAAEQKRSEQPTYTSSVASGHDMQQKKQKPAQRPETILDWVADKYPLIDYLIYVNKEKNVTGLFKVNSGEVNPNPIYALRSTDGKGGPWPKDERGDQRTPEGVYPIEGITWLKNHDPLYGPVAIKIGYPNNIDKRVGRTGGEKGNGILLCGTYLEDRLRAIDHGKDLTNGGIVFRPDDAARLARTIENYSDATLVIIEGKTRVTENYLRKLEL